MNALQTLTFQNNRVRILDRNGDPWFVAKDVCDVLDIDTTQTRRLDEDEKGLCSIQTPGGQQEMVCVNESGLYTLVLGSRKPEAKAFKRWVTHEVLPAIRQTGHYGTPRELSRLELIDMAREAELARIQAEAEKAALSQQLVLQAPKVALYDVALSAENAQPIGTVAKVLGIGPNILFRWLREQNILMSHGDRKNLPRQEFLDRQLFVVREYSLTSLPEGIQNKTQTLVTAKGLAWIHDRWQQARALQEVR